jgi:hypothetical protein
MTQYGASFSAHALFSNPQASGASQACPRASRSGFWAVLGHRSGTRRARRRLKNLDRRATALRKLIRRRGGLEGADLAFLANAMVLHDRVVARLVPDIALQELCLGWRSGVLTTVENQVRRSLSLKQAATGGSLPSTVLPTTVLDEQLRMATQVSVTRSANDALQDQEDVLKGMREVLASLDSRS